MASLVCVALLFGACAAWLLAERARLKGQVEQLQIERGEATRSEEELKQQIDQQGALSDGLAQRLNQAQAELDEKEQEIARLRQGKAAGQTAADAGAGIDAAGGGATEGGRRRPASRTCQKAATDYG